MTRIKMTMRASLVSPRTSFCCCNCCCRETEVVKMTVLLVILVKCVMLVAIILTITWYWVKGIRWGNMTDLTSGLVTGNTV